MPDELIPCPTCRCPGYVDKLDEVRALVVHPGRHFPCRVEPENYTEDFTQEMGTS